MPERRLLPPPPPRMRHAATRRGAASRQGRPRDLAVTAQQPPWGTPPARGAASMARRQTRVRGGRRRLGRGTSHLQRRDVTTCGGRIDRQSHKDKGKGARPAVRLSQPGPLHRQPDRSGDQRASAVPLASSRTKGVLVKSRPGTHPPSVPPSARCSWLAQFARWPAGQPAVWTCIPGPPRHGNASPPAPRASRVRGGLDGERVSQSERAGGSARRWAVRVAANARVAGRVA